MYETERCPLSNCFSGLRLNSSLNHPAGYAGQCKAMHLTALLRSASCRSLVTPQILRVMKLTAILLTVACLQISAAGIAQRVSLNVKDASLKTVFFEVNKQTGYNFLYSDEVLARANKVTLRVQDASIAQVLELALKDQPLDFRIHLNSIIIRPKAEPLEPVGSEPVIQVIDVTGRVTDADGNPLVGATVTNTTKKISTTSNSEGRFTINANEGDVLTVSYIGYEDRTIKITAATLASSGISIVLNQKISSMQEVVINKGYYTEKQKYSVSNVGKVTAKDIEKQPVNNPLLALQGRVPGLLITQSTGLPGSGVAVKIQGQNTISGSIGNDPLYVIDGVPYPSRTFGTLSFVQGRSGSNVPPGTVGGGNPLSYINPYDIESIEVLKDADATAIYGSRAGNGAILITTKRGKAGQTKVDLNFQKGWGKVERRMDLLNTDQYIEMRKEALSEAGVTVNPNDANYDLNGTWNSTQYTDWQKELIGGTAKYDDIQLSISGGNANTQFMISPSYHKETTVFPGDLANKMASLHFNVNNLSSNQKLNIQLTGSYSYNDLKLNNYDLTADAMTLAPNAPNLYNADGTLNWAQLANGDATWTNPLAYLNQEFSNKTKTLVSNANISYRLLKGLDVKSSFGYSDIQSNQFLLIPHTSILPQNRTSRPRQSNFMQSNIQSWIIEPQINYLKKVLNGELGDLLGSSIQNNTNRLTAQEGTGYASDVEIKNISAAPTRSAVESHAIYKYNAGFGRLNYNLQGKYLVNFNVRRDGSSRFGKENQFHNFWSIGAGWIFSNEKVFSEKSDILSFGKFKASYGTTGNDQIGDYRFLDIYNATFSDMAYQNAAGYQAQNLPNYYLAWEETRKLNLGVELGFLNDKLVVSVNYGRNRSSNQLVDYALPIMTGFNSITQNFPALVQNVSWEFMLNSKNITTKIFNWSTSFNLSIPKNKLIEFPGIETSSYSGQLIVGQPTTMLRLYEFAGVDPNTGFYHFVDKNGNITTNPILPDDGTIIINTLPKFYGGLQNSVNWKEFDLNFLFQFVKQIGRDYSLGGGPNPGRFFGTTNLGNQPTYILERWGKPGDITNVQKFTTRSAATSPRSKAESSNRVYSDASFIRLKNLSFAYNIPYKWQQKISISNAKVFLNAQNMLTFTNYKGLDPETISTNSLPPLRTITFGIHCTF